MTQKKQPRGIRNNNPGNIRHSATLFLGEIPKDKATDSQFKQFTNISFGYRAMFVILNTYDKKYDLHTIREWISRWAPAFENNTDAYINTVCLWANTFPETPVNLHDKERMIDIVAAMSYMENGVEPNREEIRVAYVLAYPS
jgi:hypothetical protein